MTWSISQYCSFPTTATHDMILRTNLLPLGVGNMTYVRPWEQQLACNASPFRLVSIACRFRWYECVIDRTVLSILTWMRRRARWTGPRRTSSSKAGLSSTSMQTRRQVWRHGRWGVNVALLPLQQQRQQHWELRTTIALVHHCILVSIPVRWVLLIRLSLPRYTSCCRPHYFVYCSVKSDSSYTNY